MGVLLKLITDQLLPLLLPEIVKIIRKREEDPEFKAHIDAWATQAQAAQTPEESQLALSKLSEIRARS